jgi:hypothetical protein
VVPVRLTFGFCPPLVVTVRVAEKEPVLESSNCTGKLQFLPAATPDPQVFPVVKTLNAAAPEPLIAVDTVNEAIVPTFETVTLRTFAVACVIVPKLRVVGATETSEVQVPLSGIAGLDPPLVVSVRVPLLLPTAVGSYSTGRTQLDPPARLVLQVLPVVEMENPAPEIDSDSVNAAVPALEMVRLKVEVEPNEMGEKEIEEAESFTSVPVPVT